MKLKKMLPVLAGASLGFAYYYFIGCRTGSCPITGSHYISTLYGALIGLVWTISTKKKNTDDNKRN
ncbi:MAG: DUF6132 family protein [Ignavibacteriales bacterium]|nr:DUF6132 family protein [Ignavibacteriales bacterium]